MQGNQPPTGGFCTREQRGWIGGRAPTSRGQPFLSLTQQLDSTCLCQFASIVFGMARPQLNSYFLSPFCNLGWPRSLVLANETWTDDPWRSSGTDATVLGLFSFFMPWKWSWRLDSQLFGRSFHPKPHSLLFLYRDFSAPNCCVCGVTQLSPDDFSVFSSFFVFLFSFPHAPI